MVGRKALLNQLPWGKQLTPILRLSLGLEKKKKKNTGEEKLGKQDETGISLLM